MRGLPAWMPGSSPLAAVDASDYVGMQHPPPSPPDAGGAAAARTPPRTPRVVGAGAAGYGSSSTPATKGDDDAAAAAGTTPAPLPSAVLHATMDPAPYRLEISPSQRRWRTVSSYLLGAVYTLIVVTIALAVWQLVDKPREKHVVAWSTAAFFVALAVPLSLHTIQLHTLHYVRPELQRQYIRILWMVPIYSIESWLALRFRDQKVLLEAAREAYESLVLYSFYELLLAFLGGREHLTRLLRQRAAETGVVRIRMLPPACCLRGWRLDNGEMVAKTKLGVFSYVFVRTLLAGLTFVLHQYDLYGEGRWRDYSVAFPYFMVILNLSQVYAMFCLVTLYHECRDLLQPLHPLGKLLIIKGVVFFSFWQGIIISALVFTGVIVEVGDYTQEDVAKGLQDYLITIEMAFAAVAHHYFFSYKDFTQQDRMLRGPPGGGGGGGSSGGAGGLMSPTPGRIGSTRVLRHHGVARAVFDFLPVDVVMDAREHLTRGMGMVAAGARGVPLITRRTRRDTADSSGAVPSGGGGEGEEGGEGVGSGGAGGGARGGGSGSGVVDGGGGDARPAAGGSLGGGAIGGAAAMPLLPSTPASSGGHGAVEPSPADDSSARLLATPAASTAAAPRDAKAV